MERHCACLTADADCRTNLHMVTRTNINLDLWFGSNVYSRGVSDLSADYDYLFRTYMGNPSSSVKINAPLVANSNAFVNGNFGIGTNAPKQSLHNTGDYYGKGHVWLHAYEGDGQNGTAYLQARDDSATSNINLLLRTKQANTVLDVMRLTYDGNVGVGTNSPAAKLDVNGTARMTGFALTAGAGAGKVLTADASGTGTWGQVAAAGLASDAASLAKVSGNIMVSSGSNIGIGTGALGARLQINTGGGAGASLKLEHSGSNFIVRPTTAGGTQILIENTGGGGIYCNSFLTTAGFSNVSDARFKKNIADLPDALESLLNLHGVSYQWDTAKFPATNMGEGRQMGFLAQEVEAVLPELVRTAPDGYKSVNYLGVIPVAVEAIKTLKAQKDTEIAQLKAKNAELETKLDNVLKRLEAMEKQR